MVGMGMDLMNQRFTAGKHAIVHLVNITIMGSALHALLDTRSVQGLDLTHAQHAAHVTMVIIGIMPAPFIQTQHANNAP
jgi:hypothetical protein